MEPLKIQSNLKYIESDQVPDTTKLDTGEAAFGIVGGIPSFYGNSDGQKVQDYLGHLVSLRFAKPIASSSDLNSLVEVGSYVCQTQETSQSVTNKPGAISSYFRLFVSDFTNNGSIIGQLVLDYATGKQFYRYRGSTGAWTAWTEEVLVTDLEKVRSALAARIDENERDIQDIQALIPGEASVDDQLANKGYVRTLVRGNASRYIVPDPEDVDSHSTQSDKIWKNLSALQNATKWYYAGQPITDLTNNDYATVEVHRQDIEQHEFWQALYQEVDDVGAWDMQFKLGSYLTPEQQAAMDSGVTATWKKAVDDSLTSLKDTKLDKRGGADTQLRIYSVAIDGTQSMTYATSSATADTLALRDAEGHIKVGSPVSELDAANKGYVDNKVSADLSTAQSALEKSLADEVKRATAAEEANAAAISTEAERAKAEEAKLSSAITKASEDLTASINAEKERAEKAETTLQNNIDTVVAESGVAVDVTLDESVYTLTVAIKNKGGTTLTTTTVDLPIETNFNAAEYDAANKQLVFTCVNDTNVYVKLAELISGLATETSLSEEAQAREAADEALGKRIDSLSESNTSALATKQPLLASSPVGDVVIVVRPETTNSPTIDSTRSLKVEHLAEETDLTTMTVPSTGLVDDKISSASTTLRSELVVESQRALDAESVLSSKITAEKTRATDAESALQSALDSEAQKREGEDTSLRTAIEQEALSRDSADSDIRGELAEEKERAEGAESALKSSINSLTEKDLELEAADTTLQTNIDNEATAREDADKAIHERLDELSQSSEGLEREIARATARENEIEKLVTDEAEARGAADEKTLTDAKDYADTLATEADEKITQSKGDSIESANSYTDTQVANATDTLKQYADSAVETESALIGTRIDEVESELSTAKQDLQDSISAEETRAKGAEEANASAIATETSRATAKEGKIEEALAAAKATIPADLDMSVDTSTYRLTVKLLDAAKKTIGTAKTVDLPIESLVIGGSYDADNKQIILELQNGGNITFSVADLVSGLASDVVFSQEEGKNGLVPAPTTQTQELFLREDGTWVKPTDTNTFRQIDVQDSAGTLKGSLSTTNTGSFILKQGSNVTFDFSTATRTLTIAAVIPDLTVYAKNADLATIAKTGKLSDAKEDDDHKTVTAAEIASWDSKQDALSFDTTPTQDSENPVTSGGLYDALQGKVSSVTATGGITATLTGTSVALKHTNSVTPGTVKEGGAARTLEAGETFNVPTITYDGQGHITSTTFTALTLPADKDTHYQTGLYIGAAGSKSNAATSNGATYLKLYDDSTSRASLKISGASGVSVSSDASGNLTITGPGELEPPKDGTLTVSAGSKLTGSGTFTANQADDVSITISHAVQDTGLKDLLPATRTYVTGIVFDGFGHIKSYSTSQETVENTDTHYTTHLYVGPTGTNASAATSNNSTYLKLYDDTTKREEIKIAGTQNVSVSSDEIGSILITGPDLSSYITSDDLEAALSNSHNHDERYLKLTGGELTGNIGVTGLVQVKDAEGAVKASLNQQGYVTGTRLVTTSPADLNTTPTQIAVIGTSVDTKGHIYYRTPAELLTDIGAAASSHTHTEYAEVSHSHAISDITQLETTLEGKASSADFLALKEKVETFLGGEGISEALDTLEELQAALNKDGNFAATVTTQLAGKAPKDHTHTNMVTGSSLTANAVILGSGSSAVKALAAGTAGQVLTLNSTAVPVWSTPVNTDTKVTSADNHYVPVEDTSSALSATASSTTGATWNTTSLVTGVTLKRDTRGHIVGLDVSSVKMPANPNSNSVTHLYVGATGTAASGATTNGATFLKLYDDGTARHSYKISGTQNVSVASDASGNITITGPDLSSYAAAGHTHTKADITDFGGPYAASSHSHTNMVTGSSLTSNAVILGNGSSGIKALAAGSSGQVLTLNSSKVPVWQTPATVTNSAHSHTAGDGLSLSGSGGTSGTTTYSHTIPSGATTRSLSGFITSLSTDKFGHVTAASASSSLTLGSLLISTGSNYGGKINFGDGDYVYLHEYSDDCLRIHASAIDLQGVLTLDGSSGSSGQVLMSNGSSSAPTWQWVDTGSDYTLPAASSSYLGGIRIGYSQSGSNYPVKLDSSNRAYVTVSVDVPSIESYSISESDWT